MSDKNKSCCNAPEAEPTVTRSPAPMWIIVVTLVLLSFGGLYLDSHAGLGDRKIYHPYTSAEMLDNFQPRAGAASMLAVGRAKYEAVCGICHGNDGAGKPGQFPALAGSEWVTAKGVNRLVHIPLAGLAGTISVAGKEWNLNMAAMGIALSDEDLAAALTYIRTSWGNQAGEVSADEVKRVRAEIGKNIQPLTAGQLKALPE